MMKVTVLDRQSLCDIALETSGAIEAVLALAMRHDIAVSESLDAGAEFETAAVIDREVAARYAARGARPATGVTPAEAEACPFGGVGYMGVEYDFRVE